MGETMSETQRTTYARLGEIDDRVIKLNALFEAGNDVDTKYVRDELSWIHDAVDTARNELGSAGNGSPAR
jgi:hypothetical protein